MGVPRRSTRAFPAVGRRRRAGGGGRGVRAVVRRPPRGGASAGGDRASSRRVDVVAPARVVGVVVHRTAPIRRRRL